MGDNDTYAHQTKSSGISQEIMIAYSVCMPYTLKISSKTIIVCYNECE